MKKKILICSVPPLICLSLLGIYLVSPAFYLRHILEAQTRETGLVEITTWIAAFAGAFLLWHAAWRLREPGQKFYYQTAALFLLAVGLAAFFLGGEEISWGQTWFGWATPETYDSGETNIHNNQVMKRLGINVNSLGSLFLIVVFAVFPIVSKVWKKKPPFFQPLEKVVPGALAISFIATGFIWKEAKSIYRALTSESMQIKYAPGETPTFYGGFLEQINEQKEMLMALALLSFAVQMFFLAKKRNEAA